MKRVNKIKLAVLDTLNGGITQIPSDVLKALRAAGNISGCIASLCGFHQIQHRCAVPNELLERLFPKWC